MRNYNRTTLVIIVLAVASIVVMTTMAVLRAQVQHQSSSTSQEVNGNQVPLAIYGASTSASSAVRALRQTRSSRYDRAHIVRPENEIEDEATEVIIGGHWLYFPALPTAESDAVVVGEVTDAQAYLSNDGTGIYSEFSVRVEDVLKNNTEQINPDDLITTERIGGRVQFPSGRVIRYSVGGQGVPQPHRRYMFFLKRDDRRQTYTILTAYELRAGRVVPLDEGMGSNNPFIAFKDVAETRFLEMAHDAIAHPQQTTPEQRITGP